MGQSGTTKAEKINQILNGTVGRICLCENVNMKRAPRLVMFEIGQGKFCSNDDTRMTKKADILVL